MINLKQLSYEINGIYARKKSVKDEKSRLANKIQTILEFIYWESKNREQRQYRFFGHRYIEYEHFTIKRDENEYGRTKGYILCDKKREKIYFESIGDYISQDLPDIIDYVYNEYNMTYNYRNNKLKKDEALISQLKGTLVNTEYAFIDEDEEDEDEP